MIGDSLLTSSDYEQIVEDLKYDPDLENYTLSPLQMDENSIQIQENHLRQLNNLQSQENRNQPTSVLLENYEGIQNMTQYCQGQTNTAQYGHDQNVPGLSNSPTGAIPCRDRFPGFLNFQIFLDGSGSGKRSWLYSHELDKVFIDMFKSLIVQFQINEIIDGLFVRALPVYSTSDFVSVPVQRCTLHELIEDSLREAHPEPNVCHCYKFKQVRHVVRSSHPRAQYDYDTESERHSVVVPLDSPQAGSKFSEIEYHFSCKTSCPRGMNRKPIEVIFTLETEQCEVLGRCVLPVKICSCPKRDKDKEEEQETKNNTAPCTKRRISSTSDKSQPTKKLKTDNSPPQEVNDDSTDGPLLPNAQQMLTDLTEKNDKNQQEMTLKIAQNMVKIKEEMAQNMEKIKEEMAQNLEKIKEEMAQSMEKNKEEMALKIEKIALNMEKKQEEMAQKIENMVQNMEKIEKLIEKLIVGSVSNYKAILI